MTSEILPISEPTGNLALAVISCSSTPVLLLDERFTVVAASASFCDTFHIDPSVAPGIVVFALGDGEWDVPQLRSLLQATLSDGIKIDAYEMDLNTKTWDPRKLVLNARRLDYGNPDELRLLLAVADVTEARANERQKDDLLREKAVLLQEVQHRVANSLQIIASVLMMSARKVQSAETRVHLHDAHSRVMSIAAVQRQLATSHVGDVRLRAYFIQLCESLAASMIRDPRQIRLVVTADESLVNADTSVSLGLIITELVINALKHAFPADRIGRIEVDYRSYEGGWILSVKDDGVGMPADKTAAEPGLGTSIVEALASKLRARVAVEDGKPGTAVSIINEHVTGKAAPRPTKAA